MIVDQAHAVAVPAADGPRRHRRPDADHTAPAHRRRASWNSPVPEPGLRGFWPEPHAGTPRTARAVLAAAPEAVGEARDFAAVTLAEWGAEAVGDDVVIAVSELVTNALRHGLRDLAPGAGRRLQLVLLGHPRRLVAVVTDPGGGRPEPALPADDVFAENGRGLLVVGSVSSAWGWAPLGSGGKAVWAAFDLPAS
ncbi:ATP-binding protein [Actinomadura atramentaria]|uniref:ATP-binding protein n=1 Tax=Actinomadura atramentaria TaxID=1990 RepID=UPI0003726E86|nr:ATP-binding protein [Actinomadura atramentaria]